MKGESLGLIEGERQERTGKQVYSGGQYYKDICRVRANCLCMSPTTGKMSEEAGLQPHLAGSSAVLLICYQNSWLLCPWLAGGSSSQEAASISSYHSTECSDASSYVWGWGSRNQRLKDSRKTGERKKNLWELERESQPGVRKSEKEKVKENLPKTNQWTKKQKRNMEGQ